jgi:uncharacterized protein HemX
MEPQMNTNPVQPSVTPSLEPQKSSGKKWIVMLLVLVLLGAGLYYYYQLVQVEGEPTPDATTTETTTTTPPVAEVTTTDLENEAANMNFDDIDADFGAEVNNSL